VPGEATPSVGLTGPLAPGGDSFPNEPEMPNPRDKKVKDTIFNSRLSPQKCFGIFKHGNRINVPFGEAMFISMPAVAQQIHLQRLDPENKVVLPHILCKQIAEIRSKV
jgi:hypothetical protein